MPQLHRWGNSGRMVNRGEKTLSLVGARWGLQAVLLLLATLVLSAFIAMAVYQLASRS